MKDLTSYNIHLVRKGQTTFFGRQDLPAPQVDPEILNVQEGLNMAAITNRRLVTLLDAATTATQESAVDLFAYNLLALVTYGAIGNRRSMATGWHRAPPSAST